MRFFQLLWGNRKGEANKSRKQGKENCLDKLFKYAVEGSVGRNPGIIAACDNYHARRLLFIWSLLRQKIIY